MTSGSQVQGRVPGVQPVKNLRLIQLRLARHASRETGIRLEQFLDLWPVIIDDRCKEFVHRILVPEAQRLRAAERRRFAGRPAARFEVPKPETLNEVSDGAR